MWLNGKVAASMQETCAWSLGQEDPLEMGMVTHSGVLAWRIPWTEDLAGYEHKVTKSQTQLTPLDSMHTHSSPYWLYKFTSH